MIHCLSSNKKPPRQLRRRAVVVTLSAARIATDDDDRKNQVRRNQERSSIVTVTSQTFTTTFVSNSQFYRTPPVIDPISQMSKIAIFLPIPDMYSTPPFPLWNTMMWLFDGENFFEDMFIRFETVHKHDGQTDGHHATAEAALMHSIARQ